MSVFHALALTTLMVAGIVPAAIAQQIVDPATLTTADEKPSDISLSNELSGNDRMIDRLVFFRGSEAWDSATTTTMTRIDETDPARLVLADTRERGFPKRGSWVSPVVEGAFPFTEVLPSWNVEAPPDTGATFEVRVRDQENDKWSEYVYMGQWGRTMHWPERTLETESGRVHVDVLRLATPATALQIRARLFSYDLIGGAVPALRQLTVVYSGEAADQETYERFTERPVLPDFRGRVLPVPFATQQDNPRAISGSTCSPTSTRMVMSYRGVKLPLTEVALGILDPEYGIFGNWNRAVAFAGQKGLDAYLTRVRNWDQVAKYLDSGTPLIASIRFDAGEFPGNVLKSTNGHLIVIRGMTPEGDLVVNDPASRERGEAIVYTRKEMENAWLAKGGVTYVILGPAAAQQQP